MKLDLQLSDLDEDSLDLTPLIDVLFLLLTFFIIAATFAAPAMEVELAKAGTLASAKNQDLSLTFSIDAEGHLYHAQNPVNLGDLPGILASRPRETPIVFNVDQKAPFAAFFGLLDEVKAQGYGNFLINGQPKEADARE